MVDGKQLSTVLSYLDIGKREAKLLLGGDRLTGEPGGGYFIAPTVFSEVKPAIASSRRRSSAPSCRSLPPKMKRRPSRWPMTAATACPHRCTPAMSAAFSAISIRSRPASCTSTVRRWAAKPRCRLGPRDTGVGGREQAPPRSTLH